MPYFTPFRSLGMEARLRHLEDHLSKYVPVTSAANNAAVREAAAAFNSAPIGPTPGASDTFEGLTDVDVVDAITGYVPVYDATNWVGQDYVQANWGVGLTTNPSHRFQVSANTTDDYTTWFTGIAFNLQSSSGGWRLNKAKSLSTHPSTWSWHSDGAPVWEIGMHQSTNNAANLGFGASDFIVYDTTANSNSGYIAARASYEEAATGGTATKWLFGRNLTTSPAASTALFEITSPAATLRALRLTTSATQSAPLFEVIDGISQIYTTSVVNPLSGLKGLHINKTDSTSATSHGISWDVGTSGTGFGQWETGVDYDTNNVNKRADFILVNDATANSGAGADCLRFSHEADDTTAGSTSLKAILSHVAGSPRAFTSFFTVEAGDTLAGMNISVNNSASGRNTLTFTQRAANNYTAISCDNVLRFGSDWSKANVASFFIRDDNAGALRLFMDSSGRFSIGTATTVTAMLMLPAGTATASTAPLKFTAGTNLTAAEAGAWEFDGTDFFATPAATRLKLVLAPTSPNSYTQTYSTADRTISAYTSDPEGSAYSGIDNLQAGTPYAQVSDVNQLRQAYETLRAFAEDIGQAVNAVIDDLQSEKALG